MKIIENTRTATTVRFTRDEWTQVKRILDAARLAASALNTRYTRCTAEETEEFINAFFEAVPTPLSQEGEERLSFDEAHEVTLQKNYVVEKMLAKYDAEGD